jgi:hypothetical protein
VIVRDLGEWGMRTHTHGLSAYTQHTTAFLVSGSGFEFAMSSGSAHQHLHFNEYTTQATHSYNGGSTFIHSFIHACGICTAQQHIGYMAPPNAGFILFVLYL